ncbi:MAG: twin-arginine translocase TatA/TatE family subunit [Myxococcota bacterium]|nr:twin-arginine translocase TatA/TatE family subunit [Myxococcota bacterium]
MRLIAAVPAIMNLGTQELIIILVIVVILFGVGKLPSVLKQLGSGVKEFRDAATGDGEKKSEDGDKAEAAAKQEVEKKL